jgi:hypothetical protein
MNRHPKRRRDPSQLAKSIIDIATGQGPAAPPDSKDPAAVQRGRMGGHKGGKAAGHPPGASPVNQTISFGGIFQTAPTTAA